MKTVTKALPDNQKKSFKQYLIIAMRWATVALAPLFAMLMIHSHRFILQVCILLSVAGIAFVLLCINSRLIKSDRAAIAIFLALLTLNLGYFAFAGIMLYSSRHISYDVPQVSREIYQDRNVLVLVPHQDDEINLCGGIIEQYAKSSEVHVVYMTNGDYSKDDYVNDASTRFAEATNALSVLGVEKENIIFLGYGDTYGEGLTHMYNMPDDEIVPSVAGHDHTYGTADVAPYSSSDYTRANLLDDIKAVILDIHPDTIFCIDYDKHVDHRAQSLFFEEAMGEILAETEDYTPTVYKGFAYSTAWYSEDDFYADNLLPSVNMGGEAFMTENNVYNWDERIRFPVSDQSLAWTRQASLLYTAFSQHESQGAERQSTRVINSDKVFWQRDTDSLLYTARIDCSSGDPACLTDFKLIDSPDINGEALPFYNLWQPSSNDPVKAVEFTLTQAQTLSEIRLYDSPSLTDNILSVNISFSDGSTLLYGPLEPNGSASCITFEPKSDITGFCINILACEGVAGLSEIEAYAVREAQPTSFVKLMDQAGNFAYDYRMDTTGREVFTLYEYPAALTENIEDKYILETSDSRKAKAYCSGGELCVYCPKGKSIVLRLSSRETGELVEAVRISTPTALKRAWWSFLQQADAEYDCSLIKYQLQYYGIWYKSLMIKLGVLAK